MCIYYRFNPLWINTALKQYGAYNTVISCFNPLWINTALKREDLITAFRGCFNPLWINTALKLITVIPIARQCFNPLWINTALKRNRQNDIPYPVSIPYGLTLLSIITENQRMMLQFQSPMD